jgi:hypothetical protein
VFGRHLAVSVLVAIFVVGCSQAGPVSSAKPTSSPRATNALPTDFATLEPTDAQETEPTETTTPVATSTGSPDASQATVEVDLSRLATGETPQGWMEVLSGDGACRQAVPAGWTVDVLPGTATSPDFYVQSILANDGVTDFKAEIAHLKATYFGELNDSANEVLIEDDHVFVMRETVRGGASYVISLNAERTACGIIVSVDEVVADQYRPVSTEMLYTLAEKK